MTIHSVPNQPHGIQMRVPIIGQQQSPPQKQLTEEQQKQIARIQIMQAVNEMASAMYVRLIVSREIDQDDFDRDVDEKYLRQLARKCMTAAKAFFEGIGVIPITDQSNSEVEPDGREDRQSDRDGT